MCRGNEALNDNFAFGRSLIGITEVYSRLPKSIQNCQSLFRITKVYSEWLN